MCERSSRDIANFMKTKIPGALYGPCLLTHWLKVNKYISYIVWIERIREHKDSRLEQFEVEKLKEISDGSRAYFQSDQSE